MEKTSKNVKPSKRKLSDMNRRRSIVKFRSIKSIAITLSVLFILVIFTVQIGFSFTNFNRLITNEVYKSLQAQAEKEAASVNTEFGRWGEATHSYALTIGSMPEYDTELSLGLLKKHLEKDKSIVGGGFWLEPYEYDKSNKYYGPYMYRDGDKIELTWDYSNEETDYFQNDWYQDGFRYDKPVIWSEPYADTVTGVPMITATSTIVKNGKKVGVVTLDIGLEELQQNIAAIKIGTNGFAYIITSQGTYLGHPETSKNLNEKITEEADNILSDTGAAILQEEGTKLQRVPGNKGEYFVVSTPIGDTGLKFIIHRPSDEVYASINQTFVLNIAILLVAVALLIGFLTILLNRLIIKPIRIITKDAEQIALGNLSYSDNLVRYGNKEHEIGILSAAFMNLCNNMKLLMSDIKAVVGQIDTSCTELEGNAKYVEKSSEQITASISEIARGISEQASSTQNENVMIQKMLENLLKLSSDAKSSAALISESDQVMELNSQSISYQKEKMEESKQATIKVSDAINSLSGRSMEIESIINTIDGIAEQTNLLALNASIEAARAGVQGKGFAVVAGEIGKLAEQSSKATQKISTLILDIQSSITDAHTEMNHTEAIIEEQEKSVDETILSFGQMKQSNQKINQFFEKVIHDIGSLENNANEVVGMIENLASISEETSASTEEISAATEQNLASVQKMGQEVVNLVKVIDELETSAGKFTV